MHGQRRLKVARKKRSALDAVSNTASRRVADCLPLTVTHLVHPYRVCQDRVDIEIPDRDTSEEEAKMARAMLSERIAGVTYVLLPGRCAEFRNSS